jgi:hypothetical protein
MEAYQKVNPPGIARGFYTLYPWYTLLQIQEPLQPHGITKIWIHGYNAASFGAKLYLDFGWWGLCLLPAALGFISQRSYTRAFRQMGRGWAGYAWAVSFLVISLMFFCYVDAYAEWLAHFPVLLAILLFMRKTVRASAEHARPRGGLRSWSSPAEVAGPGLENR